MANLLNIIIGVKKSADAARAKKKGKFGMMGSGAYHKSYEDAEAALDEENAAEDAAEKK
jgi:hypothetical protein